MAMPTVSYLLSDGLTKWHTAEHFFFCLVPQVFRSPQEVLVCGLCEELPVEPMRIRHGNDGGECRNQMGVCLLLLLLLCVFTHTHTHLHAVAVSCVEVATTNG